MFSFSLNFQFINKPVYGQPAPEPIQRLAIKESGSASPDYQVGAHFEALDEGILVAALKSIEHFFAIQVSLNYRCPLARVKPVNTRSCC